MAAGSARALEVGETATCADVAILDVKDQMRTECPLNVPADAPTTVKYKFLEFSQTTCGACLANFDAADKLMAKWNKQMTGKTVFLDRDANATLTFTKANRGWFHHDVVVDSKRDLSKIFGIMYTPTQFILDANNKVVYKHIGTFETTDLTEIEGIVTK